MSNRVKTWILAGVLFLVSLRILLDILLTKKIGRDVWTPIPPPDGWKTGQRRILYDFVQALVQAWGYMLHEEMLSCARYKTQIIKACKFQPMNLKPENAITLATGVPKTYKVKAPSMTFMVLKGAIRSLLHWHGRDQNRTTDLMSGVYLRSSIKEDLDHSPLHSSFRLAVRASVVGAQLLLLVKTFEYYHAHFVNIYNKQWAVISETIDKTLEFSFYENEEEATWKAYNRFGLNKQFMIKQVQAVDSMPLLPLYIY